MTTTEKPAERPVQSAAAPSPFPPIAEYAFLSNCHTGALVAPDGAIDWLCIPSFDSPSMFGSLLDRQAGFFRFAPYDVNHPTSRSYEPGTNVLVTTWKVPNGWVVVRDALTMGPSSGTDAVTPHTRPPADDDGDHMLVRTVECIDGNVEIELVKPGQTKLAPSWTLEKVARHAIDFWLSTEDLPLPDNRVTVDRDGKVTLSYTATNDVPKKELGQQLHAMLGRLGMEEDGLFHRFAYLKNEIPVAGVAHQAGTARMGSDPASSVVNTDCRAHEVDNLYVVDTSVFPSIGAVNPALTAMANSLRVGDHLLERIGAWTSSSQPATSISSST